MRISKTATARVLNGNPGAGVKNVAALGMCYLTVDYETPQGRIAAARESPGGKFGA